MKVFITITVIAIFMLILRVYYEKQIEGFENNDAENDSDSETEEEVSSPPSPTQQSNEPEESSSTQPEPIQSDGVKIDATQILKQINDMIPPNLVDEISKRTSANILTPQGLESQSSTITNNTAPVSEEHGELCNCDKCNKNIYIHQTFNTYHSEKPKSPKKKSRPNVRAGGIIADEHQNINFFLDNMMNELNKKYKGKNLQDYATKLKPRKHSKPKYAKHESTTGMFTFTGPAPFNSYK